MIRAVIDANLFVSAILTTKGKPARILNLVREEKVKLITSLPILEEVRRVLLYPRIKKLHQFSPKEVDEQLKRITYLAHFTTGKTEIKAIEVDPTDNKYLECAVEGDAEFIISGDHHLRDMKVFEGIRIVSPAEFIELIE